MSNIEELEYVLYPTDVNASEQSHRHDLVPGGLPAPAGSYVYCVEVAKNGKPATRLFHSLSNASAYLMHWLCCRIDGTFEAAGGVNNWDTLYLKTTITTSFIQNLQITSLCTSSIETR